MNRFTSDDQKRISSKWLLALGVLVIVVGVIFLQYGSHVFVILGRFGALIT